MSINMSQQIYFIIISLSFTVNFKIYGLEKKKTKAMRLIVNVRLKCTQQHTFTYKNKSKRKKKFTKFIWEMYKYTYTWIGIYILFYLVQKKKTTTKQFKKLFAQFPFIPFSIIFTFILSKTEPNLQAIRYFSVFFLI